MNEELFPNDPQSEALLKTVPVKVSKWLVNIEQAYNLQLLNTKFTTGRLTVDISPEGGTIIFGEGFEDDYEQLWWDGNFDNISNVRVSNLTLVEAAIHLNDFIDLERKIYNELTEFQFQQERLQPTPQMPNEYTRPGEE